MGFEWAPSLGRSAVAIVNAAVSFDAWMIGVLFKGLTFSGRFFEMVIRHLAVRWSRGSPGQRGSIRVKRGRRTSTHRTVRANSSLPSGARVASSRVQQEGE